MTGPRDPLREALLELEERAPFDSPPPLNAAQRHRWLWVGAGGLAAAAVLAGVVIGTAVLDRQNTGEASPTPSPVSTATPSPSPTATPTATATVRPSATPAPTAPEPEGGWHEVPFSHLDDDSIGRLYFDDPLGIWINTGYIHELEGDRIGSSPVRTSTNGTEWAVTGSIPMDGLGGAGFVRIGRIVRFGDVLYISATHTDSTLATSPLAWTSVDGNVWRPATTEMPTGAYGSAEVIAATGDLLIADVGERDGGHVWTSTDGISWAEADIPSGGRPMGVRGVYADADRMVLGGHVLVNNAWTVAAWTSPDGVVWAPATSLPAGEGNVAHIARDASGTYVAAVQLARAPVQLMTSLDGLTWSTVFEIGEPGESPTDMDGSASGVIYLGEHGERLRVLNWTGAGTWSELAPPANHTPGYTYYDVSVGDEAWVAGALQQTGGDPGAPLLDPILLIGGFAD